jgi:nucleoside-diphosphate-sugar epimerase
VGLTVAVTGPTGDIGRAAIRELERHPEIERIVGMARRPFDPSEHGWERTEYVRGDILDRSSVERLVAGADVVVHLAFVIFGNHEETQKVNLEGSRNVFEEAVAAGAKRLVYTSSVAAYGFHRANPQPLTEEVEPRGSEELYYSAQKAELEGVLRDCLAGSTTDAYVFRPCVVAGADAPAVVEELGNEGIGGPYRRLMEAAPLVPPILPVPRFPLQLVHHDDVARAIAAAVLGKGSPGLYNLAAPDTLTLAELGDAMGWRTLPVPGLAVRTTASVVSRIPFLPARVQWLKAATTPVIMDCSKAREELGWEPSFSSVETLRDTLRGV